MPDSVGVHEYNSARCEDSGYETGSVTIEAEEISFGGINAEINAIAFRDGGYDVSTTVSEMVINEPFKTKPVKESHEFRFVIDRPDDKAETVGKAQVFGLEALLSEHPNLDEVLTCRS